MDLASSFRELIDQAAIETAIDLGVAREELATYAAERTAHLATIIDQPGYWMAVQAERHSIALRGSILAHRDAGSADARFMDIMQGGLLIGARLLLGLA